MSYSNTCNHGLPLAVAVFSGEITQGQNFLKWIPETDCAWHRRLALQYSGGRSINFRNVRWLVPIQERFNPGQTCDEVVPQVG